MALEIYYAKIDALLEEAYMEKAMTLLPTMRLAKVEKLKQASDKRRSVAAGVLLAYALLEKGINSRRETFLKNKDGKPYLAEHPNFYYNLSHSGEYVALVLSDTEVGIDIEKLRENQQKLAKRFFSKEEQDALGSNWSDEVFTRLWTRKESYVKAIGCGMRGLAEQPSQDYFFDSFEIEKKYWLSVCQKDNIIDVTPVELDLAQMIDRLCEEK